MQEAIQLLQSISSINPQEREIVEKLKLLQILGIHKDVEVHHQLYTHARDYMKMKEFSSSASIQQEILDYMSKFVDECVEHHNEAEEKRSLQFRKETMAFLKRKFAKSNGIEANEQII